MEKLLTEHNKLVQFVPDHFFRFLYKKLPWEIKCLGLRGPRGTGKTTLLLQYARFELKNSKEHLYISMDHPYFFDNNLFDFADEFYKAGGKTLLIDEIHRYQDWSRALKYLYDAYPDMRIIFTSSSALDIFRGEADLSRRVSVFDLPGLSFREYLQLQHDVSFPSWPLEEILADPVAISAKITQKIRPLAYFDDYLQYGYFPFSTEYPQELYSQQLYRVIEATLLQDLSFIQHFSIENVQKIQKLLAVLAETAPFEPNISKLAERLGMSRDTIKEYLFLLGKGKILNLLSRKGKGVSVLQKPDKIYLENTNYAFALKERPDVGNLRETFFLNQLSNAGYPLYYPGKSVDFTLEDGTSFEIGGTGKKASKTPADYTVKDDIISGFGRTIPLYLFGFLY
ncbi:MAG TPA: AAA family ATPase [Saprospiraceae bacterium]|nr:AAA family ATPase [Saprospiraceae bacterium]